MQFPQQYKPQGLTDRIRPQMQGIQGGAAPGRNFVHGGGMRVPQATAPANIGGMITRQLQTLYNNKLREQKALDTAERRAFISGEAADYEMDSEAALRDELMRHYQARGVPQLAAFDSGPVQEPEPIYDLPDEDEEDDMPYYDYPRSYYQ